MKKLLYSSLLVAIAFAFATVTHAGSGLRDEIVDSFAVKPGSSLNFDSDLANVEITTSETDTLRAEFTREFKVSTAQEADVLVMAVVVVTMMGISLAERRKLVNGLFHNLFQFIPDHQRQQQ